LIFNVAISVLFSGPKAEVSVSRKCWYWVWSWT